MLKKISIILLFLFFNSCGYEAMHSKKNITSYDFSISEITLEGDRNFNLEIKKQLNNYTQTKKDKNFRLEIRSISNKETVSKDVAGNPSSFKNSVTMYVNVLVNNKIKKALIIQESFNYNNNANKFNLKEYEKDIKNNLAESSAKKLVFKLSNIQ